MCKDKKSRHVEEMLTFTLSPGFYCDQDKVCIIPCPRGAYCVRDKLVDSTVSHLTYPCCIPLKCLSSKKNSVSLYERFFKIDQIDVFLYGISSLVQEMRFCIMQIRKVMKSCVVPLKQYNTKKKTVQCSF